MGKGLVKSELCESDNTNRRAFAILSEGTHASQQTTLDEDTSIFVTNEKVKTEGIIREEG